MFFYAIILLISTHVPRVGYDAYCLLYIALLHISTHVPRVGYDSIPLIEELPFLQFQLTYPVWGTTI